MNIIVTRLQQVEKRWPLWRSLYRSADRLAGCSQSADPRQMDTSDGGIAQVLEHALESIEGKYDLCAKPFGATPDLVPPGAWVRGCIEIGPVLAP